MCCGLRFPYCGAFDWEEQCARALQTEVKTPDKTLSDKNLLKEESKGGSLSSREGVKNDFLRLSGDELVF